MDEAGSPAWSLRRTSRRSVVRITDKFGLYFRHIKTTFRQTPKRPITTVEQNCKSAVSWDSTRLQPAMWNDSGFQSVAGFYNPGRVMEMKPAGTEA
jgi:hypothetical protein